MLRNNEIILFCAEKIKTLLLVLKIIICALKLNRDNIHVDILKKGFKTRLI